MIKSLRRAAVVVTSTVLAVVVVAAPSGAHVVTTPNTADTKFFHTAFRVGHGCDGSPTTAVRIQIPDGVHLVIPETVPGFRLQVTREHGHGAGFGNIVEVAWVGGSLPPEQVQLFGLNFLIGRTAPAVLWFPTVQTCEVGEHTWVQIPPSVEEWHSVPQPAPYVINAAWS